MRKPFIAHVAFVVACCVFSIAPAQAACDRDGVTLLGPIDEEHDPCAALDETLRYFAAGGLPVDLELLIRFQPLVLMEIAPSAAGVEETIPVSGRFHRGKNEVQIVSSASPSRLDRKPWTLPWDADIGRSILQHEIAHAVVAKLLGGRYDKLPRAWHEALAYAVQIDLMKPDLRARVLAAYPAAEPFAATTMINDITYGFDPDGFAVRAYLTYVAGGRMAFMMKALAFEFEMVDLRDYYN